ncbi:MAG: hypothetical protein K0V04_41140 [Deltaproteobacteria bacterium]|nr:hypothetical protein [Deltaproteobacteria bacterium]
MQLISTSEYEFGFIALGGAPIGVISIGGFPVGVVAVGIVPMGLLSFACGAGLGLFNFTCGIGVGAYVRAIGLALGADAESVGLPLALGGQRPSTWYRVCFGLVAAAVVLCLYYVGKERIAVTNMTRVVDVTWHARPAKSEGIYIEPQTECRIAGQLRSDGVERIHARLRVDCGSLKLVERSIRSGCSVEQVDVEGGTAYRLRCTADRVAARENDDKVTPEVPGLIFDTLASEGRARVHAHGPPPMNIELHVDALSDVVVAEPLLPVEGPLETRAN